MCLLDKIKKRHQGKTIKNTTLVKFFFGNLNYLSNKKNKKYDLFNPITIPNVLFWSSNYNQFYHHLN